MRAVNAREPNDHPNLRWRGASRAEKLEYNMKLMRLLEREIDIPRIIDWRIYFWLRWFSMKRL